MSRFHCLECGDLAVHGPHPFPWLKGHGHTHTVSGCTGRVIPIATLCSEPTVIDESDLAPGMVVVAVDDQGPESRPFVAPPFVLLSDILGWVHCPSGEIRQLEFITPDYVRTIAGVRP